MFEKFLKFSCIAIAMHLLTGCVSTYSLKEFSPIDGQPKTAFVDIKQRAILAGKRLSNNGTAGFDLIMCAEPSPDALSSLTTELAADAKYKDLVKATLSLSQQEAASFVGLRTQTIQLLRDGMYRLCEGYMTGALTQADFAWLSRRYQRNMVALLTIEQLTRVAQVPTFGQTILATARSVRLIRADIKQIDEQLVILGRDRDRLSAEKAEAESMSDSESSKKTKLAEIQKKLDTNDQDIKEKQKARAGLLEDEKNLQKDLTNQGGTGFQILSPGQEQRPSQNESIAKLIAKITESVLQQDDLSTLCFQILDGSRGTEKVDPGLKSSCLELVKSQIDLSTLCFQILDGSRSTEKVDPGLKSSCLELLKPEVVEAGKKAVTGKKTLGATRNNEIKTMMQQPGS